MYIVTELVHVLVTDYGKLSQSVQTSLVLHLEV